MSRPQTIDLFGGADDRLDLLLDGELVLQRNPRVGMHTVSETVELGAGAHELVVRFQQHGGGKRLNVQYAAAGGSPRALAATALFPEPPQGWDYGFGLAYDWLFRVVVWVWGVPIVALLLAVVAFVLQALWERAEAHVLPVYEPLRLTYERLSGLTLARTLHIFSFSALAIAHPIFEVVSREPAFFVARNTTVVSLVAMVAVFCLGLPCVLVLIEIAVGKLSATAGSVVHVVWIAVLSVGFVMPILKRVEGVSTVESTSVALLVVGLVYTRVSGARTFATALSPAVIVVPLAFLMNSDVTDAVVNPDEQFAPPPIAQAPPIVFIVFDEFPVGSLLDEERQIDGLRYPNFARLADTATWYRNTTTVASNTTFAVPAIVAGQYPVEPFAIPTRRYYPNNLFTMLSERYDMTVFGPFLQLCPANRCIYDLEVHDDLGALVADLGLVYAHVIAPEELAAELPLIVGDWQDFLERRRFREEAGERRYNRRAAEMDRFLTSITTEREGRLYFLHSLTPHMPFEYVPPGHRYEARRYQGRLPGGATLFLKSDPWLTVVLQQRHLLQVGFVDRFVGRLMDRLKEQGVFDEALIIITADHGAAFLHGESRRAPLGGSRADVMFVPLLMKLPGQRVGEVRDAIVETVDIVPTVASVLSTDVPYAVDGLSLLDFPEPRKGSRTFVRRNEQNALVEKHEGLEGERYESLEHRLADFGSGMYALGPHASLVGLPLSALETRMPDDTLIRLEDLQAFDDVDLESHTLPLYVHGAMASGADERVSVAIAVNGEIAATTQSYVEDGTWMFGSMIPETSLTAGANDVRVFVVEEASGTSVLTLVAPEKGPKR